MPSDISWKKIHTFWEIGKNQLLFAVGGTDFLVWGDTWKCPNYPQVHIWLITNIKSKGLPPSLGGCFSCSTCCFKQRFVLLKCPWLHREVSNGMLARLDIINLSSLTQLLLQVAIKKEKRQSRVHWARMGNWGEMEWLVGGCLPLAKVFWFAFGGKFFVMMALTLEKLLLHAPSWKRNNYWATFLTSSPAKFRCFLS